MAQQASPKPVIPNVVIVVVDAQAVMQTSRAGQGIRQQHEKYLQTYEKDVQATRKELTEAEAAINRAKASTPFEEWQKRAQAFDLRLNTFNQKYGRLNQAVEHSYIAAMNELGKDVEQVMGEVATELGASLVLPTQQVILHDPRMNVTKQVIERMDAKFPSIPFPVPNPDGEPQHSAPGGQ